MTHREQSQIAARPRPAPLRRFVHDEDGSMIVFGLVLFTIMLMIGGLAVDLMRFESTRTALQQAADRCVLAAASLTQALEPADVVNDCMLKADKAQYLTGVQVDEGLNYREVTATATAATNPMFMHLMGIDELDAPAASKAEQKITNVEIVLVLDVSGSMAGTKLSKLKTAAKEFVDTLLAKDINNRISIAIVPYNAQVNLGAVLRAKYNAVNQHGVTDVDCLEVPAEAYASSGVSRTLSIPMAAYADVINATDWDDEYTSPYYARPVSNSQFCRKQQRNIVRLPSHDIALLKSQIGNLEADGNTSIMLGMKWGLALLDPAARPMFDELIAARKIPAYFALRPFDWDDEEAMKVIVLMTDGNHVSHTKINDEFKTGPSPIYRSDADNNYSIHLPDYATNSSRPYYVPHRDEWRSAAWTSEYGGGRATRQDWQEIWANMRLSYVAWQFYGRSASWNQSSRYNDAIKMLASTYASVSQMNSQLQQSCTLAKENDVLVYGIAFQAPPDGTEQIRDCTLTSNPTDTRFWDVNDLEIQNAFRAIASQISYLRLTQ